MSRLRDSGALVDFMPLSSTCIIRKITSPPLAQFSPHWAEQGVGAAPIVHSSVGAAQNPPSGNGAIAGAPRPAYEEIFQNVIAVGGH